MFGIKYKNDKNQNNKNHCYQFTEQFLILDKKYDHMLCVHSVLSISASMKAAIKQKTIQLKPPQKHHI